jgi:hypothetical protein
VRFSLKWILAAMVYVAIAAAALGTGKWHFADVLWILTLLAVGYAILVAAFATGRRRVLSAGFAVLSVCFVCDGWRRCRSNRSIGRRQPDVAGHSIDTDRTHPSGR